MGKNNQKEETESESNEFGTDEPMMLGDLLDSFDKEIDAKEKYAKEEKKDFDKQERPDTRDRTEESDMDFLESLDN